MNVPRPTTRVSIGICTYRREHVVETIRSIGAMSVPADVELSIVVADNDREASARTRVAEAGEQIRWPVRYVHAPASNISIARNACLEHAQGEFLAFVDDDEVVTRGWIAELLRVAREGEFEVVLGPVRALYADDAPRWMRENDFHSTYPVVVKDEIRTGYTCNVLLDLRSPKISALRFDLARGTSGGEDTEFFTAFHRAGGRIGYAPDAWVEEPVPPARTAFSWLAKRRFRMGQTHGDLLLASGRPRLVEMGVAGAKFLACGVMTVASAASPVGRRRNMLRGILHAGAVSGLAGARSAALYGDGEQPDGR